MGSELARVTWRLPTETKKPREANLGTFKVSECCGRGRGWAACRFLA